MPTATDLIRSRSMEITPQQVRSATFSQARKGFDSAEVTEYLQQVAEEMARLHNHAVAMERSARAARERLQSLTGLSDPDEVIGQGDPTPVERALQLAHRAAEAVRDEAKAEAGRILAQAREEAENIGSAEAVRLRSEIDILIGRREFLVADLEQIEEFIAAQRRRIQSAGRELLAFAENVAVGLGAESRPHPDQEVLDL
jgi:DivIVA domain-containing protein